VAQLVGLVVRVERESDGEPRAVLPRLRAQPTSRAYPVDPVTPFLFWPLPRLQCVLFLRHLFSFSERSKQDKLSAADCLTGRDISCAFRDARQNSVDRDAHALDDLAVALKVALQERRDLLLRHADSFHALQSHGALDFGFRKRQLDFLAAGRNARLAHSSRSEDAEPDVYLELRQAAFRRSGHLRSEINASLGGNGDDFELTRRYQRRRSLGCDVTYVLVYAHHVH